MKLLLIGMNKLRFMPYAKYYLNLALRVPDVQVHISMWDRDGKPDTCLPDGVVAHYYHDEVDDSTSLKNKLVHIVGYRSFANKLLSELHPDKLIVMHTTAAMLIFGKLTREYKGRYIFDYRDVTYERFGFYERMVRTICLNAAHVFTSSDGFRRYIPEDSAALTTHNIASGTAPAALRRRSCGSRNLPIRIAFWGRMRHVAVNEAIIKSLGGDQRFELHYYGLAQGVMRALLEESQKRYDNVHFHGEYEASQTAAFAESTDLLHNLYDQADPTIPYAMGNKYYDGLLYGIPQLCTKGSFMGSRVSELGIGLACDCASPSFAEDVFEYWKSIEWDKFDAARLGELDRVRKQLTQAESVTVSWISEGQVSSELASNQ